MNKTHNLLTKARDNSWFYVPLLIWLIIVTILLLVTSRGYFVIYLNQFHGPALDSFFVFFSDIGSGTAFGILLLLLGFFRFKYLVTGVSVFLASGAVIQVLKHMFDLPRPTKYFPSETVLQLVDGEKVYQYLSFPSGHSAAGISMFLFLTLITRYKPLGLFYFFCAMLVGISRIYLVQHFLIDVYFGALISVIVTTYVYNLYDNSAKIKSSLWYNYSLYDKLFAGRRREKNN